MTRCPAQTKGPSWANNLIGSSRRKREEQSPWSEVTSACLAVAGTLCVIHGGVGGGDERSRVATNRAGIRVANARRAPHVHIFRDDERRAQAAIETRHQIVRAAVIEFVDDHELVAAESGDNIGGPQDREQAAGRLTEHDNARIVGGPGGY